ncbi:hypothetical protein GCM10028815_31440 [Mariniluteicoccus flavus]
MESTIGLVKTEVIDHENDVWTSWRQIEEATASWVHWDNSDPLHSSIGDVPPVGLEQSHYESTRGHGDPVAA